VTVPAAAVGDTVAVSVILVPSVVLVDDAASVVVVAVVVAEDVDESSLPPQALRLNAAQAMRVEQYREKVAMSEPL